MLHGRDVAYRQAQGLLRMCCELAEEDGVEFCQRLKRDVAEDAVIV